jgi:pyruvate dehydrogenase E1 component
MTRDQLRLLRDRLYLAEEIPDSALDAEHPPYYRPPDGSPEREYLEGRLAAQGGSLPTRIVRGNGRTGLPQPASGLWDEFLIGSKGQSVSTTMAFARMLRSLMRDPGIGRHVVPIIPDEGRTFGLDALFSEVKIYAAEGQHYTSVDAGLLLSYAEDRAGQILEEGISEAGGMGSFQAAGTAYSTWSTPMIPMFLFYSMFGFQRVGDLMWQAADARARGFLLGCTAGRTTLNGEGLQHEDGQSHLLASTSPPVRAYDPAFAYELAFIVADGIRALTGPDAEDLLYYITLYNENYAMPPVAEDPAERERIREGVVRGCYRYQRTPDAGLKPATILFSGTMWQAAAEARELLAIEWGVGAECWSVTSYKDLREDALDIERWNRLHPRTTPRQAFVSRALSEARGPVVAVTDYLKAVPDQIARFVQAPFVPLGTDGFGRSDTRAALRRHFEVDAAHIVVAVLASLAAAGEVKETNVSEAIKRYRIDPDAPEPRTA